VKDVKWCVRPLSIPTFASLLPLALSIAFTQ
jgi:hypothetical protein